MTTSEKRIRDMMVMTDAECATLLSRALRQLVLDCSHLGDRAIDMVAERIVAQLIGEVREAERLRVELAARGSAVAAAIEETGT